MICVAKRGFLGTLVFLIVLYVVDRPDEDRIHRCPVDYRVHIRTVAYDVLRLFFRLHRRIRLHPYCRDRGSLGALAVDLDVRLVKYARYEYVIQHGVSNALKICRVRFKCLLYAESLKNGL